MRVIAGTARSCRLAVPKGLGTRPTADRLKENLFNILQPRLFGACFLDLFSGSGAIGIEALSRGARETVLVEKQPEAASVIRENLKITGLQDRAKVLTLPVPDAIRYLSNNSKVFDFIFMDPPYESTLLEDTLARLADVRLLGEGGILIAELPAEANAPQSDIFELDRVKTYGGTQFAFYHFS